VTADAPTEALAAARLGDEIAHGFGLAAMVAGAVAGALIGAAVVAATAATGGLAAVIMAGAIAGGGLAMDQIVRGLTTIFDLPEPTSGVIGTGSLNVLTNARCAVRAGIDQAAGCSGVPFNHPTWPGPVMVQEGSASVFINGHPAARLKSMLLCGAHLKTGSPDVVIGGETVRVGFVLDLESWMRTGLEVLGLAALAGAAYFAVIAGAAAVASFVGVGLVGYAGMEGLGQIGDALGPGYRDLLQGMAGMAMLAASPRMARTGAAQDGVAAVDRARITRLSNQGKIDEARNILRPHVQNGNAKGIVDRLDVSSPKDGGYLWSGNKVEAGNYARRPGDRQLGRDEQRHALGQGRGGCLGRCLGQIRARPVGRCDGGAVAKQGRGRLCV
jgi:uncharacterized Zn-binding protein involved in type VI secretion